MYVASACAARRDSASRIRHRRRRGECRHAEQAPCDTGFQPPFCIPRSRLDRRHDLHDAEVRHREHRLSRRRFDEVVVRVQLGRRDQHPTSLQKPENARRRSIAGDRRLRASAAPRCCVGEFAPRTVASGEPCIGRPAADEGESTLRGIGLCSRNCAADGGGAGQVLRAAASRSARALPTIELSDRSGRPRQLRSAASALGSSPTATSRSVRPSAAIASITRHAAISCTEVRPEQPQAALMP